jgi:hypothetical protein
MTDVQLFTNSFQQMNLQQCGIPEKHSRRMAEIGVETAEQLISIAATEGGKHSLSEHLGITDSEVAELLNRARAKISPQHIHDLEARVDTDKQGLGAILPDSTTEN